MGSVTLDIKDLVRLRDQLKGVQGRAQMDTFCRKAAQGLAARLLSKVVSRTPVGDYSETYELTEEGDLVESGKQGGELKRAWLWDNTLEVCGIWAPAGTWQICSCHCQAAKELLGERKIHADQIRGGNPQDCTEVS